MRASRFNSSPSKHSNVVDVRSAAGLIVATAMRGELPDLLSIGRDIEAGNRDRTVAEFPTMPLGKWKNCANPGFGQIGN